MDSDNHTTLALTPSTLPAPTSEFTPLPSPTIPPSQLSTPTITKSLMSFSQLVSSCLTAIRLNLNLFIIFFIIDTADYYIYTLNIVKNSTAAYILLILLTTPLTLIVFSLTTNLCLLSAKNVKIGFSGLWAKTKPQIVYSTVLQLLSSIALTAGFVITILLASSAHGFNGLGYAAIGIPISFLIAVLLISRYFLSPFVLLNENLKPIESLKRGVKLSNAYPKAGWGLIGFSFLFGVFGRLPFIGSLAPLVATILLLEAAAVRYLEIKNLTEVLPAQASITTATPELPTQGATTNLN